MRFRFVHAADLHLDTPFSGLGAVDAALPDLQQRLRDASLAALERVVAQAIAVDAAFVVFAGDLYDGVERGVRAQLRFRAALERLAQRGIASFVAHGNHDPEGGRWTAVSAWPEGVTLFPAGTPTAVPVVRGGETLATVHGVSYGARAERENLALRFPRAAGAGLQVAVLHCSVEGQSGHETYSPCTLEDLRSRNMGYWALGHVHRHLVLSRAPWVVYPGNTQGRGFGPGERGPKGAVVVDVEDGAVARVTPFATDAVRFFEVACDIAAARDLGELGELLRRHGEAEGQRHEGVEVVIRGRLTGRGPLHRALRQPSTRDELLTHLRDQTAGRVTWLALEDAAAPDLDVERLRRGDDLRAAVLATRDAWAGAGPLTRLPEALRARLDEVGAPPVELLAQLLDEAALDVLERLTSEDR